MLLCVVRYMSSDSVIELSKCSWEEGDKSGPTVQYCYVQWLTSYTITQMQFCYPICNLTHNNGRSSQASLSRQSVALAFASFNQSCNNCNFHNGNLVMTLPKKHKYCVKRHDKTFVILKIHLGLKVTQKLSWDFCFGGWALRWGLHPATPDNSNTDQTATMVFNSVCVCRMVRWTLCMSWIAYRRSLMSYWSTQKMLQYCHSLESKCFWT